MPSNRKTAFQQIRVKNVVHTHSIEIHPVNSIIHPSHNPGLVERGILGVKYLTKEHNTMTPRRPNYSESSFQQPAGQTKLIRVSFLAACWASLFPIKNSQKLMRLVSAQVHLCCLRCTCLHCLYNSNMEVIFNG